MLATFSERVGNVDHPVREAVRPVVCLLDGLLWIGKGSDETQSEILVDLPVSVGVEFESDI